MQCWNLSCADCTTISIIQGHLQFPYCNLIHFQIAMNIIHVMFAIQFLIVNDVIGMLLGPAVVNITHT